MFAFFFTVYIYTQKNVNFIYIYGILGFVHRYITRVEDLTCYIRGTKQILSGGKVFQVKGTANAKCPEAGMFLQINLAGG